VHGPVQSEANHRESCRAGLLAQAAPGLQASAIPETPASHAMLPNRIPWVSNNPHITTGGYKDAKGQPFSLRRAPSPGAVAFMDRFAHTLLTPIASIGGIPRKRATCIYLESGWLRLHWASSDDLKLFRFPVSATTSSYTYSPRVTTRCMPSGKRRRAPDAFHARRIGQRSRTGAPCRASAPRCWWEGVRLAAPAGNSRGQSLHRVIEILYW